MDFVGDLMNEPWLKAYMFPANNRMTLTVKEVRRSEVSFDGKEQELHTVMSFQEINPELTLSKVNIIPIIKMLGNDVKAWRGKRITFYTTNQVMPHPMRKDEPCIRVYGSPEISEEMVSEWTPPKRRKLVQRLYPTGYYRAALQKIKQSTPEQREQIKVRIGELVKSGELTEEEQKSLIAEIAAMG
jgi:hypothetical protein